MVQNYNGAVIRAEAETLWRWDSTHPSEIFTNGFRPRQVRDNLQCNATTMNLQVYVNQNTPSIFVSTTHSVRSNGYFWTPRNRQNTFRYEIYAPGGIDVNLSLGNQNQYSEQNEIAFPGGIRREFILSAREYDSNGRIVRHYVNPVFEPRDDIPFIDAWRNLRCNIPSQLLYPNGYQPPSSSADLKRSTDSLDDGTEVRNVDGHLEDPDAFCSYDYYMVDVSNVTFVDPHYYDQFLVEPFGDIYVQADGLPGASINTVWRETSSGRYVPGISRTQTSFPSINVKGTEAGVCFWGYVQESNGGLTAHHDVLVSESNAPVCSSGGKVRLNGYDPRFFVEITFSLRPCGDDCAAEELICGA